MAVSASGTAKTWGTPAIVEMQAIPIPTQGLCSHKGTLQSTLGANLCWEHRPLGEAALTHTAPVAVGTPQEAH